LAADIPVMSTAAEDGPSMNIFRPSRLQQRRSHEEPILASMEYPSDEDIRESGGGILEFTPAKAGLDMTPANFDFETKDEKKRATAGLTSLAAGALSSVSNTLMNVVASRYDGSKRNQELAPLLQDQNASPEAHAKGTSISSVPKSVSSTTLPVSSPSTYSQYDEHGQLLVAMPNMQGEVTFMTSSPLEVERRLNELSKQLTRLEHKMSSDIALILHVLQSQGHSQLTSPSSPPPPPPRMGDTETFPSPPTMDYSNVYDYPSPPLTFPPPPATDTSTVPSGSDVSWMTQPAYPDSSLTPHAVPPSSSSSHSIPSHLPDPMSPSTFAYAQSQSSQSEGSTSSCMSTASQMYPSYSKYPRDGQFTSGTVDQTSTASNSMVPISSERVESSLSGSRLTLQDSQLPRLPIDSFQTATVGPGATESALTLEQRQQTSSQGSQSDDSELYKDTVV
ncbi:unnamed protein product, partial [Candidula unifasciata]